MGSDTIEILSNTVGLKGKAQLNFNYYGGKKNLKTNKLFNYTLVFFCLCLLSPYVNAEEGGIEVTGTAKESVVPDMATFLFSINGKGKVLETLKNEIDTKTADLVSLCKKTGVKTKDITSSEVSIRPEYNYQTKSFIGFNVSRNVKVILKNLDHYTDLVNGAIKSGITTISSIALDTKDREKLERKALGLAIAAAKEKADIMAKSSGVTLGKVIYIKEGGSPIRTEGFAFREKSSSAPVTQGVFEPGEISVTATVVVKYSIN